MSILSIFNIVIALLSILSCVLVWRIYKLTNSKSMLFFVLAIFWGALFRIIVAIYEFFPETISVTVAIGGFWVFFPIGMFGLLHTLKRFYK